MREFIGPALADGVAYVGAIAVYLARRASARRPTLNVIEAGENRHSRGAAMPGEPFADTDVKIRRYLSCHSGTVEYFD